MAAPSEILLIANALVIAHGAKALAAAERGADNVRLSGRGDRVEWWDRVAAAIREIQAATRS